MIIRKLRLQRGWSQEQLAQLSGLSIRTIQRLERGQKPSLESSNALSAVFEVELSTFTEANDMTDDIREQQKHLDSKNLTIEEQQAIEYVKDLKGFYGSLTAFAIFIPFIFILNYMISPQYYWAWWALIGWGIGIVIHGALVFELFSFHDANWERKQVEKRLGRKL
ncbi:2TM domain-containing protein [Shewanella maritima]|uniref:2TM domain-containing protein n=1 Tax=Shewanella maritima TaxID=2520507 RepID=UPI0037352F9B